MAAFTIPAPAPLDMASSNLAENWKKFKQRYNNFELATGIASKTNAERVATILSVIGQEAVDVYNTFTWAEAGDSTKIAKVTDKFETFCAPKKNITYERYLFNSRCQKDGESIDSFVTSLRQLADTYEFENLKESLIRDRVVIGVKSKRMTQRLLRTENLTLAKATEIVRAEDAANTQCAKMADHDKPQHAKAVRSKHAAQSKKHVPAHAQRNKDTKTKPKHDKSDTSTGKKECNKCGGSWPHAKKCPAEGQSCNYCHRKNHFAAKCRLKARKQAHANAVDNDTASNSACSDTDSSEYTYVLRTSTHDNKQKQPRLAVTLDGQSVTMLLDTGASVNILCNSQYNKLKSRPKLQKTSIKSLHLVLRTDFR